MITVTIDGRKVPQLLNYNIDIDLLSPADAFSIEIPLYADLYRLAHPDARVQFFLDERPLLRGSIDTIRATGQVIQIEGRDRIGRLVDCSVPGTGFAIQGDKLSEIVKKIISPYFKGVIFSNASNRTIRRGKGSKAKASREPAITRQDALAASQRVEAGVTRWEAIERILQAYGLLAWSDATGDNLIIASTNYTQETQYHFFETPTESNVLNMTTSRSIAQRYEEIIVSGSGSPPGFPRPTPATSPGVNPPRYVSDSNLGRVKDTSNDFVEPKRLFVVSDSLNRNDAQIEADRLYARGLTRAESFELTVEGHGQVRNRAQERTTYTPDTMAHIFRSLRTQDNRIETIIDSEYYITKTTYIGDGTQEVTQMSLIPKGARIV